MCTYLLILPIISICYFKYSLSVVLIPSTTFFPLTCSFIVQSIIILYKNDKTVIRYISKAYLYLFAQSSVSFHTVHIPDTNINFLKKPLIYETYEHMNHIHLVHCHYLYINEIQIFFIATRINSIWKIFKRKAYYWSLYIYTPMLTLYFFTSCFSKTLCIIFL